MRRARTGLVVAVLSGLVVATALTGCSGGSGTSSSTRHTPTASATTAYPSGAPSGTVLTEPGSDLPLGAAATVTWQPRQSLVGTLRLSVDRVERTTYRKSFRDWKVDATKKTFAPYFVHAQVTNVGRVNLGGVGVPLYGESAAAALVEPAVFKERFKPCHPSTLPKPFVAGASASVCLVYLVPDRGQLVGAAFRPTQEFAPIVWGPADPALPSTSSPTASSTGSPSGSPSS